MATKVEKGDGPCHQAFPVLSLLSLLGSLGRAQR